MHNEYTDRMPDYIENRLNREEADIIKNHLMSCPDCLEKYAVIRSAWIFTAIPEKEKAPDFLKTRIKARIREQNKSYEFLKKWETAIMGIVFAAGVFTAAMQIQIINTINTSLTYMEISQLARSLESDKFLQDQARR